MAIGDVKLLGVRACLYVNRIQFALNIKSIDFEFILEDSSNKSELFLKSNPVHKKIPVLLHGDKFICESLIIVEYIDEVWSDGPSILPSDPRDRAIARFWAAYLDENWVALFIEYSFAFYDGESKAVIMGKILETRMLLEDAFVKISAGRAFFGGENIGYLDIALGCCLGWMRTVEIIGKVKVFDEAKTPGLVGWAERFSSETVTQGIIPDPKELIELLKLFLVARAAAAVSN